MPSTAPGMTGRQQGQEYFYARDIYIIMYVRVKHLELYLLKVHKHIMAANPDKRP